MALKNNIGAQHLKSSQREQGEQGTLTLYRNVSLSKALSTDQGNVTAT